MSQRFRIKAGGRINRGEPLTFKFDGRAYDGFAGDTLASALLANGVRLVGRSFKYHRPRGILSAGSEEPNALVTVGESGAATPNLRATQVELYDGLIAVSQNRWPSLNFDMHGVFNAASNFLPAGFYYKTFMWPASLWTTYEHFIRNAAGMGRAPDSADPDRYDKMHRHCDVLIVGAGPAGLAAALATARTGARVIIADEDSEFGGDLLASDEIIDDQPASDWLRETVEELASFPEVTRLPRTTVFGYYDHNHLAALERITDHNPAHTSAYTPRQRLWTFRAKHVILATGAIERSLVFQDNERPGTMLANAAHVYDRRYAVKVGQNSVLFTGNDSAYQTALSLSAEGVQVTVLDSRAETTGALPQQAIKDGIKVLHNRGIAATHGGKHIEAVEVANLTDDGSGLTGIDQRLDCDALLMSGGWSPTVHLFSQSQGKLQYDETIGAFVPHTPAQRQQSVGACNGSFALADCLAEGWNAGLSAAKDAGFKSKAGDTPRAENLSTGASRNLWLVPSVEPIGKGGKHFVDFQNDSTAADIQLAAREGFVSIEHMKRYTTTGMGTDQGKIGNINGLAILSQAVQKEIAEVGVTTFRAPYTPVTFGAMAGRDIGPILADPLRKTPIDAWHERAGAAFELVSQWRRPFYYPKPGDGKWDAVNREIHAVRNAVGILDATTLGKIDIQGPDAAKLLNWVYVNNWDGLKVGHCRYGLMCGEDGMVFDDGVTARLGDQHYLMHTTTSNAARVLGWIEEWLQTEWPDMQVYCASVTEQYATINLAGPNARALLATLTDMDVSSDAFPFMTWREAKVADIPARIFRVSFTGELSYEINVPASYGMDLWNTCMTAGQKFGLIPFGTEALHVLRAEKGYIAVGQDTDGTVTPSDLGMGRMVSKKKDFLGKRSLIRADMVAEDRRQFVGLLTTDPNEVLPEGAHIVEQVLPKPPMKTLGHVTSSYFSPTLDRSIALAMLDKGHARMGEPVRLPLEDGRVVTATVSNPVFFDPKGERLHG